MSGFMESAGTIEQLSVVVLSIFSVAMIMARRISRDRRENGKGSSVVTPLTREEILMTFIEEAEEILGTAKDPSIDEGVVRERVNDLHQRLSVFLFTKFGTYTTKRLHDHDGFRLFVGAFPASLSPERIRLCRHIETDIRRLLEVLNRSKSSTTSVEDLLENDDLQVHQVA
jgi:hypothetical protein